MFDSISKWKDKITHYIDLRIQLIKLGLIDRASSVLSYFIFTIVSLFIVLGIFIFLGMGIAEFFAAQLHSYAQGYFLTAGIYILLLIVFVAFRKKIIDIFSSQFISILTENDQDKSEEEEEREIDFPKVKDPDNPNRELP
jgi:hypothetical protein